MDFWLAQAEILLSGLLFVAHHAHRDMDAVCEWVLTQDRPGELGPGEVRAALDSLNLSNNAAVSRGAIEVAKGLVSVWEMEERTRSSIYATAQTVIWPWTDPGVAASARVTQGQARRRTASSGSICRGCCLGRTPSTCARRSRTSAVGPGVRWAAERPHQPGVPPRRRDR
jgi:hypothetical protein